MTGILQKKACVASHIKYNNHIERLDAARKNIQHCIKLMRRKKCNDYGGGDGVLVFEKYPIPDMLKEPEQEFLSDHIDWGGSEK